MITAKEISFNSEKEEGQQSGKAEGETNIAVAAAGDLAILIETEEDEEPKYIVVRNYFVCRNVTI
jgi:hypothetical protein